MLVPTYAWMVRIDAGVRKSFELTVDLHQAINCGSRVRLHQAVSNLTNDLVAQTPPGASLAAERDKRQSNGDDPPDHFVFPALNRHGWPYLAAAECPSISAAARSAALQCSRPKGMPRPAIAAASTFAAAAHPRNRDRRPAGRWRPSR